MSEAETIKGRRPWCIVEKILLVQVSELGNFHRLRRLQQERTANRPIGAGARIRMTHHTRDGPDVWFCHEGVEARSRIATGGRRRQSAIQFLIWVRRELQR